MVVRLLSERGGDAGMGAEKYLGVDKFMRHKLRELQRGAHGLEESWTIVPMRSPLSPTVPPEERSPMTK